MLTFELFFAFVYALWMGAARAQSLWVYDPTVWRPTRAVRLVPGAYGSTYTTTLEVCKQRCTDEGISCASILWNGDIDSTSSTVTATCTLHRTRFGFTDGGFAEEDGSIGAGSVARLQFSGSSNYFEKPIDLADTVGQHLMSNAIRLNGKNYAQYAAQTNDEFNYDQYLVYYRDGIPGYVNNSESQRNNKFSVVVELEGVESPEECAKYCTRNRGTIDASLGTRCISFNYNKNDPSRDEDGGKCHLLSFALDGATYNFEGGSIPVDSPSGTTGGWFYYEGLVGQGCWVVQGQCRKWNDASYQAEQALAGNEYTVGQHVGVIRSAANDEVCAKCANTNDFTREFEYICLSFAREFHEDACDNEVDSASVAFWGQDGAGVTEIWNGWDFSEGCVIDLSTNPFEPDADPYDCIVDGGSNVRFAGKKFRDSIGEEQFAAGINRARCWERANEWYEYCGIGGQMSAGSEQKLYLNVSFPSENVFYLAPAINCSCDEWGMKVETAFGTGRQYCTRNSNEAFCYRQKQQNYWDQLDILCDDLSAGHECEAASAPAYASAQITGCYLYYPQPSEEQRGKTALNFECDSGAISSDEFIELNDVKYKAIACADIESEADDPCANGGVFNASSCARLAQNIHERCGNHLQSESQQIVTWYRPSGQVFAYPPFAAPYETTIVRGLTTAAKYTERPEEVAIDMMPIRNGRWQSFRPTETGALRQIDVYFTSDFAANLTMVVWYGDGITSSIFLNEIMISVPPYPEADYVRFPLDNITVTAGELYTWQVSSVSEDVLELGSLGYVRGNGYPNGIGDLAWDYIFISWIEGADTENAPLLALVVVGKDARPWFEAVCLLLIALFAIFVVFLCFLHWRRKREEEQERAEDKEWRQNLRKHAKDKAETERAAAGANANQSDYQAMEDDGSVGDDNYGKQRGGRRGGDDDEKMAEERYGDDVDAHSDSDAREQPGPTAGATEEEDHGDEQDDGGQGDYYEEEAAPDQGGAHSEEEPNDNDANFLAVGGGKKDKKYSRVKSASKNKMSDDDADGGDGYVEEEHSNKKKKKKKRKNSNKPRKKHSDDE